MTAITTLDYGFDSRLEALATAQFWAISTSNELITTRPHTLPEALRLAKQYLAELDLAISRFRPDSEVSRLAALAATGPASWHPSRLFLDHLDAGLRAARITDGLVDPTVGQALVAAGYDADLSEVRTRVATQQPGGPVPGWQSVRRTLGGDVKVPAGTLLDLGSAGKAHAADSIARLLAHRFLGGFLVNLGGDVAVAGDAPAAGWSVGVEAADGRVVQVLAITDQAVATSSTTRRTWPTDAGPAHHVIDPRTGRVAEPVWAQVTCLGADALEANAASTAAIVLGEQAVGWLTERGVAARLERPDGFPVFTPGWPVPQPERADGLCDEGRPR